MIDNFRHQGSRRILAAAIKEKGIENEDVLEAIATVPRHFFIGAGFDDFAYNDVPFSIGCDQTISQPSTVARQTELLDVKKGNKVLEIGTGSGYQAAILDHLGARVYTVERQSDLYFKTKALLKENYPRIKCFLGDGYKGLAAYAPFDRIIITAAAPFIPQDLVAQLKIGGKMVVPLDVEDDASQQEMILIEKLSEDNVVQTKHGMFMFVPMLKKVK
ncbi:MAG: protein-L-isoaspartate(D-aspartate) O-methyltransferase [Bacteroidales bacterium]|nr:protein-L-isoaspartate(D-aspartate) O-methyltransferase [Bacteroidales bacterium]